MGGAFLRPGDNLFSDTRGGGGQKMENIAWSGQGEGWGGYITVYMKNMWRYSSYSPPENRRPLRVRREGGRELREEIAGQAGPSLESTFISLFSL